MKITRSFAVSLSALLVLWMSLTFAWATDLTADEVMNKNFYVTKISVLTSDATMTLINDKGQRRERKIRNLSKLQEDGISVKLFIRFETPADVRGTTFLQIQQVDRDDDMWIYLPALKKTRRLVSNNKHDSFVGSDFAYADILPLKPSLFRHSLLRTEVVNGYDCFVIESVPREEGLQKDLGYSKSITWIRKDNFLELRVDYFDLDGQLLKTQTTADHKLVETNTKRWLAMQREMINHQTGHKTLINLDRIDTKAPVSSRAFAVEAMERN